MYKKNEMVSIEKLVSESGLETKNQRRLNGENIWNCACKNQRIILYLQSVIAIIGDFL